MWDFFNALFTQARLDIVLVIAGLGFLALAVIGSIKGKISVGRDGRIVSGVLGVGLIIGGLVMQSQRPAVDPVSPPAGNPSDHPPRAHQPSPHMGDLEWGKNRPGNDLTNFQASGPESCAAACQGDERCKAMTFVQHPNAAGGICWLKGDVAPLSDATDMVSAVKRFD